jgi:hypothetical protein
MSFISEGGSQRKAETRSGPVHKRRTRLAATVLAGLVSMTGVRIALAEAATASEYQVKAAFLFHFAQFVEWPDEAFKDASSPLTYCTIGDDPFRGLLDSILDGKTLGTRSFRVRHFKQPQEIQGCQVLFLGTEEKKPLPEILAKAKANSVLTVGESENFAQEGGMIGFVLAENKIRFEINLEAAQKAKLRISSRLLALAKNVIGGQRGT